MLEMKSDTRVDGGKNWGALRGPTQQTNSLSSFSLDLDMIPKLNS